MAIFRLAQNWHSSIFVIRTTWDPMLTTWQLIHAVYKRISFVKAQLVLQNRITFSNVFNFSKMEVCFLCNKSDNNVKCFVQNTLHKCIHSILFRKKNNFLLILFTRWCTTSLWIEKCGYHSACYKKVTAFMGKYKSEFEKYVTKIVDDDNNVSNYTWYVFQFLSK